MRVLVLDQATQYSAYCIVEVGENGVKYLAASTFSLKGGTISRILDCCKLIKKLINEYNVDKVVLEEVSIGRKTNLDTTVVLIKLLGCIEMTCCHSEKEVIIMNVAHWKKLAGIKSRTREDQKKESIMLALKRWKPYSNIISGTHGDDIADCLNMSYAFLRKENILK